MKHILKILKFLWVLPVSLIGWTLLSILAATKQVEDFSVNDNWAFIWDIRDGCWFYRITVGWSGGTIGNNIILFRDQDTARELRTLQHENKHVNQQYKLGVFFLPIYILESIRIYLFCTEQHSYYDNWFEIQARKAASQTINIPKSKWRDGPKDRWAWW